MKAHAIAVIIRPRWRIVQILVGVVAVPSLLALPMAASAGDGLTSWKIDLGISSVYDNNILRYSDKYVDRFDNRQDEGRFHINTRDDLILVSSIRASAIVNLIGSLKTAGAVDVRRRTYTYNTIKDWSYIGFSLRQDISKLLATQIGYSYIPSFYVRHYRDDDWVKEYGYTPVVFQSFEFKKDETNGWIQYALFSGTRMRARFSYMRYFYNEHFTEYDSRNTLLGLEVFQTIHKNLKVNGGFEVVRSRGDGNADMDPSYDEDTFVLGGDLQLPRAFGRTNSVGIEGEYSRRCYTSNHVLELDRNHAGRIDYDYRLSVSYSYELLENLALALTYAWHRRDTETAAAENATYLSDEKDYRQYQIGLEARYTLNFLPGGNSELERSR